MSAARNPDVIALNVGDKVTIGHGPVNFDTMTGFIVNDCSVTIVPPVLPGVGTVPDTPAQPDPAGPVQTPPVEPKPDSGVGLKVEEVPGPSDMQSSFDALFGQPVSTGSGLPLN